MIDGETLYVLGFNFTRLNIRKKAAVWVSETKNKTIVAEANKLFEADSTRQPYTAGHDTFLVSPENARTGLANFIRGAKKELLIYDMKISDRQMLKLLQDRVKTGVDVRILGKVGKKGEGLKAERMPGMRLHLRAMLRDGSGLFLGSMSPRAVESDKRREVGVIVKERAAAKQFREIFEEDWAKTVSGKKVEKDKKVEKEEKKKRQPSPYKDQTQTGSTLPTPFSARSNAPKLQNTCMPSPPKPTSIRPTVLPFRM